MTFNKLLIASNCFSTRKNKPKSPVTARAKVQLTTSLAVISAKASPEIQIQNFLFFSTNSKSPIKKIKRSTAPDIGLTGRVHIKKFCGESAPNKKESAVR